MCVREQLSAMEVTFLHSLNVKNTRMLCAAPCDDGVRNYWTIWIATAFEFQWFRVMYSKLRENFFKMNEQFQKIADLS